MPVRPDHATELAHAISKPSLRIRMRRVIRRDSRVRTAAGLMTLLSTLLLIGLPASTPAGEIRWSQDGKWLVFGQDENPEARARVSPGWLFRPEAFDSIARTGAEPKRAPNPGDALMRLWVMRADLKFRQELDRSDVFLSDPCWTPDGTSIVYARVDRLPGGSYRWTLREVYELSRSGTKARDLQRIELPPNWSVPPAGSRQAVVLRQIHASSGQILHGDPATFEPVLYDIASQEVRARFPKGYNARAGAGGAMVAWLRGPDEWPPAAAELVITNVADGRSQVLGNFLPDALPVFSSDGRSLYAARHQKPPEQVTVSTGSDWPDIARIDLRSFKPERFSRPIMTPVAPPERLAGFSVALDVDEEMLLCAATILNRPAEISWFQPKTAATYKRFPPLDVVTHATELSLSADQRLALRLGTPAQVLETSGLPAAICDPRTEMLSPLVPDEACLDGWIDFLVRAVIRNRGETPGAADPLAARSASSRMFTVMPTIEETTGDNPLANRLRRIGNIGLASLGIDARNPDLSRLDRLSQAHLEAASLFFALTRRYDAALASLDRIDGEAFDEQHRCRLYAVAAQLNVAAGRPAEGLLILEALKASEPRNLGRVSFDGRGGWVIEPERPTDWENYLERMTTTARNAANALERTPDEPLPGGQDLRPAGNAIESGVGIAPP